MLVFLLALLLMLVNFFIAFVISDCELIPLETLSVGILQASVEVALFQRRYAWPSDCLLGGNQTGSTLN